MMSSVAKRPLWAVVAMALVLSLGFCLHPAPAAAGAKLVAIAGMSFNANASLADNLKGLKGKKVSVTTGAGKVFTGLLKAVGPHLIQLEKLERKEYFDALIRIQDISAVEAQFRSIQR